MCKLSVWTLDMYHLFCTIYVVKHLKSKYVSSQYFLSSGDVDKWRLESTELVLGTPLALDI